MPIKADKAREAIHDNIAQPLGQDVLDVAMGIHRVANATMMRAIKAVTTYRGRDPRDFVLFAFGGSGGVHAVDLARDLGMKRVVVPPAAGVFSALGLLIADVETGQTQAFLEKTTAISLVEVNRVYRSLEETILAQLGCQRESIVFRRFAHMRYSGQAYELTVPVGDGVIRADTIDRLKKAFDREHKKTYGHSFPDSVSETVSLKVVGSVPTPEGLRRWHGRTNGEEAEETSREAYFGPAGGKQDVPVLNTRAILGAGPRPGPLIVEEYEATIVIPPRACASLDDFGSIIIETHSR